MYWLCISDMADKTVPDITHTGNTRVIFTSRVLVTFNFRATLYTLRSISRLASCTLNREAPSFHNLEQFID